MLLRLAHFWKPRRCQASATIPNYGMTANWRTFSCVRGLSLAVSTSSTSQVRTLQSTRIGVDRLRCLAAKMASLWLGQMCVDIVAPRSSPMGKEALQSSVSFAHVCDSPVSLAACKGATSDGL
eukprot:m.149641 g.149641  ORF g.149641 m.149641 type:complete len:123 (+) comp14243_c0_seq2:418-786(+)